MLLSVTQTCSARVKRDGECLGPSVTLAKALAYAASYLLRSISKFAGAGLIARTSVTLVKTCIVTNRNAIHLIDASFQRRNKYKSEMG
jgi:hypothetical protein